MTLSGMGGGWVDPPPRGHQLQVAGGGAGVKDVEGILPEAGVAVVW